jgi:ribonuclease T2
MRSRALRRLLLALLMLFPTIALPAMLAAQDPRISSTEDMTPRRVPVTGYTLALSWEPEYCHGPTRASDAECRLPSARGFILHGLWPDGAGPGQWPQYCRPAQPLTAAEMRAGMGITPSTRLLQHEWAKHGTCVADNATSYFTDEQRVYRSVHAPDLSALAGRRDLTDRTVRQAVADANPGITPDMVRLHLNQRGWLQEVWFCLGRDKRPVRCAGGGGDAGAPVRIQAPGA